MITTADFKRGLVIQLDNAPCIILDVTTQSPSARGGNTLVKTKYRNLLTGQVLEKTFKSGDKADEADFERHKGQFLYATGEIGVFMDLETYEQFELGDELFGPVQGYLLEGTEVQLGLFQGQVVSVDPPMTVERVHQEHGQITLPEGIAFDDLPIGTRLRIYPNHICMTAAMYDQYHVVDSEKSDGREIVAVWPRVNGW